MVQKNPMIRATIIDRVGNNIGTTLSTAWTDSEVNQLIDNEMAVISNAVPYVMYDKYTFETRTGTATSTSSNNLVDTAQTFAEADIGKTIFNTTDKTWAVIQSYSSATQVGLSADIMASGEGYQVYNKGCFNNRQINIEDSGDWLWVIGAIYPATPSYMDLRASNNMRNVTLFNQNKIAEIDVVNVDDSGKSGANTDVYIVFARQHVLAVGTDLVGATTEGKSAGDNSIAVDGLDTSSTYYMNNLFYFSTIDAIEIDSLYTYRLTQDTTMSSGAGTLYFFPALECNVVENEVITFIASTLTPELESVLIELVTGDIMRAQAITTAAQFSPGGSDVSGKYYSYASDIQKKALFKLKTLVDVDLRSTKVYPR